MEYLPYKNIFLYHAIPQIKVFSLPQNTGLVKWTKTIYRTKVLTFSCGTKGIRAISNFTFYLSIVHCDTNINLIISK